MRGGFRRRRAIFWLVLPLVSVLGQLAGCGEKSVSRVTPPPVPAGDVVIDTQPDSLDAPWRLAVAGGGYVTGRGDSTLTGVAPGDYVITWQEVAGWNTPFSRRLTDRSMFPQLPSVLPSEERCACFAPLRYAKSSWFQVSGSFIVRTAPSVLRTATPPLLQFSAYKTDDLIVLFPS